MSPNPASNLAFLAATWPMSRLLAALSLIGALAAGAASAVVVPETLLSVDFDDDEEGFVYMDDAFDTTQPSYADGTRAAIGGFEGSGGLQVTLGGVDSTAITSMSGGWSYTLNLDEARTGVVLSLRYKLTQSATYEYDEYSRVLAAVDGVQYGRGAKDYVDHIGGDGSSSQGNSSSYLPTTDWQQVEIYLGDLDAGGHELVIGAYNNKKNAADESTTLVIDEVLITSDNPAPTASDAQRLVGRLDPDEFLGFIQGVAQFGDRCRGSGMGCSSYDTAVTPSPSSSYGQALAWVEAELVAMGYTPVRHTFSSNTGGTNLYATKVGTGTPSQMYMVSAHLDARSGGDGFDDDGSGVALVLEAARVFAESDVTTDKSVRFIFWDKEETGLNGAYAYASNTTSTGGRRALQGVEDPPGSGQYPEPTWLGLIQHDMILYDHGAGTPTTAQSLYADLDVEWRAGTTKETDSRALALKWAFGNGEYAPDYPATAYNFSTNTDDTPFHPYVASISVRENRRSLSGEWINPYYHTVNDVENSYTRDDDGDGLPDDIELGFNAVQSTVGLVAELAGVQIAADSNNPPEANPQSITLEEGTSLAITLSGTDPDSDPLTYDVVTGPSHGTLTGTAPNLTYTPTSGYTGGDSFTFTVDDGELTSPPATVAISVTAVNHPPVANGQTLTTAFNTPVAITLSGSDLDGDPLTYLVTQPIRGSLAGTAPNLIYTPATGFGGIDSFSFRVNDGTVSSAFATISIQVDSATYDLPFSDDFETPKGWVVNPAATDRATAGRWERGNPQDTNSGGPKQLGTTVSGAYDLVTGAPAGANAGSFDLDGGITSIRSPNIRLPSSEDITLSFSYYLAHGNDASADDYLRVRVVGASTSTLLEVRGRRSNVTAAWQSFSASLNAFAGQTVYLLIEAADLGQASLVEAAIDDLSIAAAAAAAPLLTANFATGADGFGYQDDAFRGTSQPDYASGDWLGAGGRAGGALRVSLGGVDTQIIDHMSGGWSADFTLAEAGAVNVSFWFNLTQSPDYESDEISQALARMDGVLLGQGADDFVAQVVGNGNGGSVEGTGWRLFSVDVGPLAAGAHTLTLGGYNNRKTYTNESSEILLDDVTIRVR